MYDLHLTAEQLEMRDTVRAFVRSEVKLAALRPDRLEPFEKPLLAALLAKASQMGLRALALSEEAGGAGGDNVTCCIVLEELAVGDVDLAMALAHTALLARIAFDEHATPEQRERYLPRFLGDDAAHLAFAGSIDDPAPGWRYHGAGGTAPAPQVTATRAGSDWVLNGTVPFVANAPIARLFVVPATGAPGPLLVAHDAAGLTVGAELAMSAGQATDAATLVRWHHGPGASVTFRDCKVPAAALLGAGKAPFDGAAYARRLAPLASAVNLGVGESAYQAAIDYTKLRRQGGRNIIEHEAIGGIVADLAIRLEAARGVVWKAAWVLDHPDAVSGRSVADVPLHQMARVFTSEVVHQVATGAAECFGGMGVMRDMPLQKHVHDALVFQHGGSGSGAAKLAVAEAVAGFRR